MRTYIRHTPFPKCKHCQTQLDFYYFGMHDEDHECDECCVEQMANRIWDNVIKSTGGWKWEAQ